jgi:hypothetical protein
MNANQSDKLLSALNNFQIETPSWGFADTGTRFGKFSQDAAAIDVHDKLADAVQVHQYAGCCPSWGPCTIFRLRCKTLSAIRRFSQNLRWVRPLDLTSRTICSALRRIRPGLLSIPSFSATLHSSQIPIPAARWG